VSTLQLIVCVGVLEGYLKSDFVAIQAFLGCPHQTLHVLAA